MFYRRAAGIIAAFLMVPSLLRGSEIACPRHGEGQHAAATATAPMQGEGHEHHHQGSQQDNAPGRHPVSGCCPAMSTCSGTAIQAVETTFSFRSLHNERPADLVSLSQSRVESPDPPPPKA